MLVVVVFDAFLGRITTRTSLDRTLRDMHIVRLSAVDGGGLAGYAVVRVHVITEPAALPTFLMTEYRANVFATVDTATSVVRVRHRMLTFLYLMIWLPRMSQFDLVLLKEYVIL